MGETNVNFSFLQRTCSLVVLLCFLHISVTVFYYVKSLDFKPAFMQNQQSQEGQSKLTASQEDDQEVKKLLASSPFQPNTTESTRKLEKCPDPSPLLGKSPCCPGEMLKKCARSQMCSIKFQNRVGVKYRQLKMGKM